MNNILKNMEIIEDEIISIEEFDVMDTIDIEVDSVHKLFFANDILTHNSGWLTNDSNITSLGESGGLLHTVDVLFGIITDPTMKARGEYYLKCLANRVAGYENCRKRYTIDWRYLRIEEDRNSPIQDMEFFINSISTGQKHPRGYKQKPTSIDAVISSKVQSIESSPDNRFIGDQTNVTGKGLFPE